VEPEILEHPMQSVRISSRTLPNLSDWFEKEDHAFLLYDERSEGRCLFAIGARRSFTWGLEQDGCLEAWGRFIEQKPGRSGWTFGWLGYDLKNILEDVHSSRMDSAGFPVIHWIEPRIVVAWGGEHTEPELLVGKNEPDGKALLETISLPTNTEIPSSERISLRPRWDRSTYLQRVQRVKKHIQRGDIYELNLCQEWHGKGQLCNTWNAYLRLQRKTKAPYSALIKAGEFELLCGSPELFLKKRNRKITSSPIKGTIRRGETIEEDDALAHQLFHDTKERAENVMICDLVRNDLSKIAAPGSVNVPELFGIHRFQSVHQMISSVECELADGADMVDIIKATFPMGSMTGAPKVRTMQIIDDLEGTRRGIYSGSVGCIQPNGDFDLNVVIRSIASNRRTQRISMQVGGAITALSDPEREYEECLLKAEAMMETLNGHA